VPQEEFLPDFFLRSKILIFDTSTVFTSSRSSSQSIIWTIKPGLSTNPLISESDLLIEDYEYEPEVINVIFPIKRIVRWLYRNCNSKDDKWLDETSL